METVCWRPPPLAPTPAAAPPVLTQVAGLRSSGSPCPRTGTGHWGHLLVDVGRGAKTAKQYELGALRVAPLRP